MASAESVYVDPSALRCLYVHEARSRAFCAWRSRHRPALPLTLFGRAEIENSLALAVFRRDLTAAAGQAASADLDADLRTGRLYLADLLWRRALDEAVELSRRHTPALGTRALDVLHVASALTLGYRRFVTYDARQARLAQAVKLRVSAP
ncbi:MAG TPA: type II toxin-antitoxin system VapC family toxin [Polyangia bacterium]|nr:type II toxin-antitoxin system VapC family toxin [Polyangia bacterium]